MDEAPEERRLRAARRIVELAEQFGERSHDLQVDLVREFQEAVREHAALTGAIDIEDDDDEQLVLGSDGRFGGRLLADSAGSDGGDEWLEIAGPSDVVDHYDAVDLFADLADAVREQFPETEEPTVGTWAEDELPGDGSGAAGELRDTPPEETESGSRRVLRDLHDAGVYSDTEYAAKLAELDRSEGA